MYKPIKQDQAGQRSNVVSLPLRAPDIGAPFYSGFQRVQDPRETAQETFHQVTLRPVGTGAAVASGLAASEKSR